MKKSELFKIIKEILEEEKPGLWANIRAKRKRVGKKGMAKKGSKAYKSAKKAGKKINAKDEGKRANTPSGDMAYTQKANEDESLIQEIKEYYIDNINEIQMIEDALNEEYCPECASEMEEGRKKKKCKPSKGKRFAKRVDGKCRSFGQKGKASDGGDRIRPGTKKAHAYCARSAKIKKCKNPPCANTLSRKKWKCQGSRSVPESIQERFQKLAGII